MPFGDVLQGKSRLFNLYVRLLGVPFVFTRLTYLNVMRDLQDITPIKNKKILDIGCRFGLYTLNFAKSNLTVGLDISLSHLISANKKKLALSNFVLADATQLPFKDEYFDMVLCLDVIEHIPTPQLLLWEIKRVLKTEGRLTLTTPHGRQHGGFTAEEITALLTRSRMIPRIRFYFKRFSVLAWKIQYFFWRHLGTSEIMGMSEESSENKFHFTYNLTLSILFPFLFLLLKLDTFLGHANGRELLVNASKYRRMKKDI